MSKGHKVSQVNHATFYYQNLQILLHTTQIQP
jgi:hypothetical protein